MKNSQPKTNFDELSKWYKEVIVGLFLLLVAIVVLYRNEGVVAQRYQMLDELKTNIVSVWSEKASIYNENLLLHVIGEVEAQDPIIDEEYGIISNEAIKMRRVVSMYQWNENIDDSVKNKTQYFYTKLRSQKPIDSSRFHEPWYNNPPFPKSIATKEQAAQNVYLGDFALWKDIFKSMKDYELLALTDSHLVSTLWSWSASWTQNDRIVQENTMIQKQNETSTGFEIGDLSISFQIVPEWVYTIVAKQSKGSLLSHDASKWEKKFFVKRGEHSPAQMFAEMTQMNIMAMRWIRVFGIFTVFVAVMLILRPISFIVAWDQQKSKKPPNPYMALIWSFSFLVIFMVAALAWMFVIPRLSAVMICLAMSLVLSLKKQRKVIQNSI